VATNWLDVDCSRSVFYSGTCSHDVHFSADRGYMKTATGYLQVDTACVGMCTVTGLTAVA